MKMYWPTDEAQSTRTGMQLEARALLAWELVGRFALIAGKRGSEDSSGRATLELATPEETVARAFAFADLFVSEAEKRDAVRDAVTCEHVSALQGFNARIKHAVEYDPDVKSDAEQWRATVKSMVEEPAV